MVTAPPEDLVRRLYEAPPDGFVAVRTEAAAAARAAGDRATARQIAALRKPTVAAWLVNLLALRRPDLVDELAELAELLREAQRNLRGEQLRELSSQRRKAVAALVEQARRLAVEAEPGLGRASLPLADVEATLTAALADADIAEQVRTGRLVRTVALSGFGEVPRPRLRLLTGGDETAAEEEEQDEEPEVRPEPPRPGRASRDGGAVARTPKEDRVAAARERAAAERRAAARRAVERELRAAQESADAADAAAEEAADAEHAAARAVAELDAALADLERRRAAAQADASRAKLAHKAAIRDVATARRRLGEVQGALDELDG